MISINKILFEETYSIRGAVLRKGKPLKSCFFVGDEHITTNHYGIHNQNKLFGVISTFESSNSQLDFKNQIQIRGMAILEEYQNKGFGKKLLEFTEKEIEKSRYSLIWFNARENAIGFYEKLGYETFGYSFEIEDIGTHYIMFKQLNSQL